MSYDYPKNVKNTVVNPDAIKIDIHPALLLAPPNITTPANIQTPAIAIPVPISICFLPFEVVSLSRVELESIAYKANALTIELQG